MIVKAIYKDKNFDYFNDKETGLKRHYGDIFECDDKLANERIKNKFVKKATKDEEKEYYVNQTIVDDDLKPSDNGNAEGNTGDNGEANSNDGELSKNDDEFVDIKPLEECTKEELISIAFKENICVNEQMTEEQLIEIISEIRAERLEQSNGGEE